MTGSAPNLFSRLPSELLKEIWDLACIPGKLSTRPICRALLPFQQETLFRNISLHRLRNLNCFTSTILDLRPDLALTVKSITLDIRNTLPTFDFDELGQLFAACTNLETLTLLEHARPQHNLVQSLETLDTSSQLSRLRSLSFQTKSTTANPFDPNHFRFFSLFPSLESFTLSCNLVHYFVGRATRRTQQLIVLSNTLVTLAISGSFCDHPEIARLCSSFPHLLHLYLIPSANPYHAPEYPKLLPLLPTNLESLSLLTGQLCPPSNHVLCQDLLPRFVQLKHLHLGRSMISKNSIRGVFNSLSPRLKSVVFGEGFSISVERGQSYVIGPKRVEGLKKVVALGTKGFGGWSFEATTA